MKMANKLRILCCIVFSLSCTIYLSAQSDPEFPEGFIMYGKLHSGMITGFSKAPDLYVGGVQLAPQVTVVPHLLRAGIVAGAFYTNKKIGGEFGPSISLKLKTLKASLKGAEMGSLGNINVLIDHLWGTNNQRLAGGGILFDIGNLLTVGLTAHRDYRLKNWWFQSEIGIRISKKKKNPVI